MSIQSNKSYGHRQVEKLFQLFCLLAGFQVDCFTESNMFCAVSTKNNTRIMIGFFEDSSEHEFFLNDSESEFVTNITRE